MVKIVLSLVFVINSMASDGTGSQTKGMVYYKYLMKEPLDMRGDTFSKQYTSAEWLTLFDQNATLFKKKFSGINPQLDALFRSSKFVEIMPHLKAFVVYYAKDKKNSPTCEEKE